MTAGSILVELVGGSSGQLEAGDNSAWYDATVEHRWQLAGDNTASLIAVSGRRPQDIPLGPGRRRPAPLK